MFLLGSNMISNRRPISTCPPRTESGKPAPRRKQERQTVCVYVANTCQCYRAGRTFLLVPKKPPKPLRDFHVGDRVKVNPHRGRTVDAVIKAVTTDQKGRVRLQVEFGKDKTAFVYNWQLRLMYRCSRLRFHGKETFTRLRPERLASYNIWSASRSKAAQKLQARHPQAPRNSQSASRT